MNYKILALTTQEFAKEKLFWMHMAPHGRFALAEPNVVCNQKCFMVTGDKLDYLCAVLNSSLVTWLVRRTAVTTGMGLPQWDKFTVERVPIVHPDPSTLDQIRNHVRLMLAAIDNGDTGQIVELQRVIDQRVFELYDLTPGEIAVVTLGENR